MYHVTNPPPGRERLLQLVCSFNKMVFSGCRVVNNYVLPFISLLKSPNDDQVSGCTGVWGAGQFPFVVGNADDYWMVFENFFPSLFIPG